MADGRESMILIERVQRGRAARRHTCAGLEAYERGDLSAAEREFDRALWYASGLGTGDQNARRAYLNMAVIYIEQGKYLEGRQVFRQALASGRLDRAPDSWEPVPLWGFYGEGEEFESADDDILVGLKRTLRTRALNPVPALRDLAAFERRSMRAGSASRLLALANSL
jgi:tetratricopeptide (TPR) repeat protein